MLQLNFIDLYMFIMQYDYDHGFDKEFQGFSTVDDLIFLRYQFSWFSWRVLSTIFSANKIAIFCMNYEGKYYDQRF